MLSRCPYCKSMLYLMEPGPEKFKCDFCKKNLKKEKNNIVKDDHKNKGE